MSKALQIFDIYTHTVHLLCIKCVYMATQIPNILTYTHSVILWHFVQLSQFSGEIDWFYYHVVEEWIVPLYVCSPAALVTLPNFKVVHLMIARGLFIKDCTAQVLN